MKQELGAGMSLLSLCFCFSDSQVGCRRSLSICGWILLLNITILIQHFNTSSTHSITTLVSTQTTSISSPITNATNTHIQLLGTTGTINYQRRANHSFLLLSMTFVNALSVSQMEDAFQLTSIPNNSSIKRGEALLDTLRASPLYPSLIISYISGDHSLDNKIRAALQLRDYIIHFEPMTQSQQKDLFGPLLFNYLHCEDKIAGILIDVFNCLHIDEESIEKIVASGNEGENTKIRVLRLLRSSVSEGGIDAQFDAFEGLSRLLKYLCSSLEEAIRNNSSDHLKYRIIKLFYTLQESYDIRFTTEQQDSWVQMLVGILGGHESEHKYLIRSKIMAMQSLLYLMFNTDQESQYLDRIIKYTSQIWQKYVTNRDYAKFCIEYFGILASNNYYTSLFPGEYLSQAIQKIVVILLEYLYNEEIFYSRFATSCGEFLSCYFFSDESDEVRVEAIKCIKMIANHNFDQWMEIANAGAQNPPLSNQFLAFLCDSYSQNLDLQNKLLIQNLVLEVYKSHIHPHFFQVYQSIMNPSYTLPKPEVIRLLNELRLIDKFINHFEVDDLKVIVLFCSSLPQKSERMSEVCYNFIRRFFRMQEKKKGLGLEDLGAVVMQVFQALIRNKDNVVAEDLYMIESGVVLMKEKPQYLRMMKDSFKDILLLMIQVSNTNSSYDILDCTFKVMWEYMNSIGFEAEFESCIVKTIDRRILTYNLIKCYLRYLMSYTTNMRSAESLFTEMSSVDFWVDNAKDALNGTLFVHLLKLIPRGSQIYKSIVPNFLGVVSTLRTLPSGPSQVVQMMELAFKELIGVIKDVDHVDQFYACLMDLGEGNRCSESKKISSTLLTFLTISKPTGDSILVRVLHFLLKKRCNVTSSNQEGVSLLLFQLSPRVLFEGDSSKYLSQWGSMLNNLVKWITTSNDQMWRQRFVGQFQNFVSKYNINVAQIINERFQIKLSRLITQKFD